MWKRLRPVLEREDPQLPPPPTTKGGAGSVRALAPAVTPQLQVAQPAPVQQQKQVASKPQGRQAAPQKQATQQKAQQEQTAPQKQAAQQEVLQ